MTSDNSTIKFPTNLYQLIEETFKTYEERKANGGDNNYANCLISLLKKYHLWPMMKVKKFKGRDDIVLLHNTYLRKNVDNFKELYEQCRSVVLDFSLNNNNIVVTYANSIPERIDYNTYISTLYSPEDKIYEAYDGTTITIYNYKDEWYFGTSSCPDANSSKFSHPTKRHGNMFDEILFKYYKTHFTAEDMSALSPDEISLKLRSIFVQYLDPNMAYEFIIVHHENKHIIDYTGLLGENYMEMFHINTKNRDSLVENDIMASIIPPLIEHGVKYPLPFQNIQEAFAHINNTPYSYGLIVKKMVSGSVCNSSSNVKLYKISTDAINYREETDPCHPNIWMNILSVYMKNKTEYTIKDYIANYNPNIILPLDNNGQKIDPTYLVHTIISTIKDSLYSYYKTTTTYYPNYNRYKMNRDMDKQFPPIIQYHLAQLRNLQVNTYKTKMINMSNVYHYLCQCNDVNNIKTLIQFFASNPINEMSPRTSMCFAIMTSLIS